MAKSPAFQFYPKDWLGSMKVRLMTSEERGGYMELLCHAWLDNCSLPDNDNELAILSGLGERWFNGSSIKIRACFEKKGNRLIQPRLKAEQEKQEAWREKCSEAGRKSAEARKNKDLDGKGSATSVERVVQPKSNSSVCSLQSSSSSSITPAKKNKEKSGVRFTPPTLEQVKAYCDERGNNINPQLFIDHYETINWMRGKNKIKSWEACVRTWEQREKDNPKPKVFVS